MTGTVSTSSNATALGAEDGYAVVLLTDAVNPTRAILTDEGAPRPADPSSWSLVLVDTENALSLLDLAPWRRYHLHVVDSSGQYIRVPVAVGNDDGFSAGSVEVDVLTNPTDSATPNGSASINIISSAFTLDGSGPAAGYGFSYQFDNERWYSYTADAPRISITYTPSGDLYIPRLFAVLMLAGDHLLTLRDASGREYLMPFTLTAPLAIFGAWAPVPYDAPPNQDDGLTALTRLRYQNTFGDPSVDGPALSARARTVATLAGFNVSGFLQSFPRSRPFSSDDWNAADLIRYFTFNETGDPDDDHALRAVLDSGYSKAGLLPWTTAITPGGQRFLSPFWRLLPFWSDYPQCPSAVIDSIVTGYVGEADSFIGADGIPYLSFGDPEAVGGTAPGILLPCPKNPVDIIFLGRCGGWGRYVFDGNHARGVSVDAGSTYYGADSQERWSDRGRHTDTLAVFARVPRRELIDALEELRTSPVVWCDRAAEGEDPDWQRVIIEPESFTTRRVKDKAFDIAFSLRWAAPLPTQGA